jgi:hypothetical protein
VVAGEGMIKPGFRCFEFARHPKLQQSFQNSLTAAGEGLVTLLWLPCLLPARMRSAFAPCTQTALEVVCSACHGLHEPSGCAMVFVSPLSICSEQPTSEM